MLDAHEIAAGWQPMSQSPRDGTRFDVLVSEPGHDEVVAKKLFWGEPLMGARNQRVLRGDQAQLSSYLRPRGWKLPEVQNG
jgi:hypothetical protein